MWVGGALFAGGQAGPFESAIRARGSRDGLKGGCCWCMLGGRLFGGGIVCRVCLGRVVGVYVGHIGVWFVFGVVCWLLCVCVIVGLCVWCDGVLLVM